MRQTIFLLAVSTFIWCCQSQTKTELAVGGPCEGCEATEEYGALKLSPVDTLPGFRESKHQIKLTGTVYKNDGITPAEGVVLYIHHTDRKGIYPAREGDSGWARRHGYLRGWIKTGADGKYTFYTFRPASYPSRIAPEHIHVYIKEPGKTPYYIDDFVFDDDPLLTPKARTALANRGGSGIVTITQQAALGVVDRDIILGKNIANYQ